MKIEKINDNQFRCTMSMGELLQRHLTIRKLSQSPPDATRLVRELIDRSVDEVGFVPNDLPVMVEAVKNPDGDMVFTVTKINSPDELPQGFQPQPDVMRMLQGFAKAIHYQAEEIKTRQPRPLAVFAFYGKDSLIMPPRLKNLAGAVGSSLYFFKEQSMYYLVLTASPKNGELFNRACLLMSEYGRRVPSTSASKTYYAEYGETVYPSHAIEILLGEMEPPADA
ncbi:MAG: adaptor protein MecA [Lachnospiraceae bacterium]|nr:adaptor protein MecA [Lachnospiraceae bacterium]